MPPITRSMRSSQTRRWTGRHSRSMSCSIALIPADCCRSWYDLTISPPGRRHQQQHRSAQSLRAHVLPVGLGLGDQPDRWAPVLARLHTGSSAASSRRAWPARRCSRPRALPGAPGGTAVLPDGLGCRRPSRSTAYPPRSCPRPDCIRYCGREPTCAACARQVPAAHRPSSTRSTPPPTLQVFDLTHYLRHRIAHTGQRSKD